MAKVIAIASQKGGTAKTSTTAALAGVAANEGEKVLLLDLDPQCSLTVTLGASYEDSGIHELLKGANAEDVIQNISSNVDIIAGERELANADVEFNNDINRNTLLRKALRSIKNRYDIILIDTPPQLGILLFNALIAADTVIIPVQADMYALQSINQLAETIVAVKEEINQNLQVGGVFITRYNARTTLSKDMRDNISDLCVAIGCNLYKTNIREGIAVKEAAAMNKNLIEYAPKSNPAQDYIELAKEIGI